MQFRASTLLKCAPCTVNKRDLLTEDMECRGSSTSFRAGRLPRDYSCKSGIITSLLVPHYGQRYADTPQRPSRMRKFPLGYYTNLDPRTYWNTLC